MGDGHVEGAVGHCPRPFQAIHMADLLPRKDRQGFLDDDGQPIAHLLGLETRRLAAPQSVLEAGEELIRIDLGSSQPHTSPPLFRCPEC